MSGLCSSTRLPYIVPRQVRGRSQRYHRKACPTQYDPLVYDSPSEFTGRYPWDFLTDLSVGPSCVGMDGQQSGSTPYLGRFINTAEPIAQETRKCVVCQLFHH